MKHAEELYQQGFISYPRTETDQFDQNYDLKVCAVWGVLCCGGWGAVGVGGL